MKIEKFLELVEKGENERIEFKEKISKDIAEEICAFANALGGYIIIGVSDKKELIGLKKEDIKKAKDIISNFAMSIIPPVKINLEEIKINGKYFLVIEVQKSGSICGIGGISYIRVGTSKRPLSIQEILGLGAELLLVHFDETPTEIKIKNIWEKALKKYEKGLQSRNIKIKNIFEHLKKIKVIVTRNGKEVLSFAGALIFLENPQEYYTNTFLRIIEEDRYIRLSGPIWKIIEDFEELFFEKQIFFSLFRGFKREDYSLIPKPVLREALVNALVHRNYAIFSETFVEIKKNKIIIKNPGSFPPGVTLKDPCPIPRNPTLYELMFNLGFIEKQGRGIKLILDETKRLPYLKAYYEFSPNFTQLTFEFLPKIDEIDKKILELLSTPKSSSDIGKIVSLSKPSVVNRLKKLENLGLIKKIGSGNKTKYVVL